VFFVPKPYFELAMPSPVPAKGQNELNQKVQILFGTAVLAATLSTQPGKSELAT
jgi:hypothetical protein